jgi:hypothetical protein
LIEAFGDLAYYKGIMMALEAISAGDKAFAEQISLANIELVYRGYHKRHSNNDPPPSVTVRSEVPALPLKQVEGMELRRVWSVQRIAGEMRLVQRGQYAVYSGTKIVAAILVPVARDSVVFTWANDEDWYFAEIKD